MDLMCWAAEAKRGEVIRYYRGHLAWAYNTVRTPTDYEIEGIRKGTDAYRLYLRGQVHLVQRRDGRLFDYLAVRR